NKKGEPLMKTVTAVTLNPCTDRTLQIPQLIPGEHHVVQSIIENAAGKGIDVNAVLAHIGVPTLAIGFEFSRGGEGIRRFLEEEGIPFRFHAIEGEQRVNTKVFDLAARQMTEINCKGPKLDSAEGDAFLKLLEEVLPETAVLVVCGSVPPGLSPDLYRRAIELAHAQGIPCVLDATGPLLVEGLKANPDVIKPNIGELELLLGKKLNGTAECVAACRELTAQGVGTVCLTLGKDGAIMVSNDEVWFSEGLDIAVRGAQGAGDSVVAGICAAMLKTQDRGEWLRSGVAAAHGSLIREGTLLCEKDAYDDFLSRMPVSRLSI
ncbi:MAG: 1-phosphofructokinase family hexose kinase, partial [Clostridia bacterium]|nr:1-phosphofructokinase family hexose kinase [Clostridia bacterium]